ncbi:hypothetical protein PV762_09355 [Mitsuaria sp. CC2]
MRFSRSDRPVKRPSGSNEVQVFVLPDSAVCPTIWVGAQYSFGCRKRCICVSKLASWRMRAVHFRIREVVDVNEVLCSDVLNIEHPQLNVFCGRAEFNMTNETCHSRRLTKKLLD